MKASRWLALVLLVRGRAASAAPSCAGDWTPVPPAALSSINQLYAVSALGPNDAWAVGEDHQATSVSVTLREHWDGNTWTVVPGPSGPLQKNALRHVLAFAPNDVWAVGYSYNPSGPIQPLRQHWDGATFTAYPGPAVSGSFWGLAGVAPDDVWAVGGDVAPFAEHWDGTRWGAVPVPGQGFLYGVTALRTDDVWAVGSVGSPGRTLVMHWDGVSWSVVPSPLRSFDSYLWDVSAVAPDDIWAVGHQIDEFRSPPVIYSLELHWDGIRWSESGTPWIQAFSPTSVVAVCSGEVYVVGPQEGHDPTVLRWDGSAWCWETVWVGTDRGDLRGLGAIPGGGLWAVGEQWWLPSIPGNAAAVRDLQTGTGPVGTIGNALRAAKQGADVHLDWSLAPLAPRWYNVHRVTMKMALAPPPGPPLAPATGAEEFFDRAASPPLVYYYQVFGRDCQGLSIP